MKVYRLLRNNQETGPFTAEEILQKGLKPYDLIWVDGKSAAWRYPSEIDAFKHYVAPVEEQPYDRFYKKTEAEESKPAAKPIIKPKFRIRADSHKIELVEPEGTSTPQYEELPIAKKNTPPPPPPIPSVETASPAWQEALNDWQEKQPQTQPAKQERAEVKKENVIQFPPSSPEELDETYHENFFRTKSTNNRSKQVLSYAVLGILAPLLIAGMWFGFRQENKEELPAATIAATENKDDQNAVTGSASKEKNTTIEVKQEDKQVVIPPQAPVQTVKPNVQEVPAAQHNTVAPVATKHAAESTMISQPVKAKQNAVANAAPTIPAPVKQSPLVQNKKPIAQQTVVPATNTATAQITSAKPKESAPVVNRSTQQPQPTTVADNPPPAPITKSIGSYVDVQQENLPAAPGEKSVRFHVKNLGDAQVDLVVLDLQYFDGRGKLRKGSTMYFKKIPAQNDIAVDAPIVKDADRVSYKVSLLSIEQKGVYIVAE